MPRPNNNNKTAQAPVIPSAELSPQEFIKLIGEGGEKPNLSALMPDIFWQQAEAGCPYFIIDTAMVEDRLLSIQLTEPISGADSVDVKVRFSAKMDSNFQLVPLSKDNQGGGSEWLSGFRSNLVTLDQSCVDRGWLTDMEIRHLHTHAEFYSAVGNDAYNKDRNYTKIRPYLSPVSGKQGQFVFLLDVRLNPRNNEETIGIVPKYWTPGAWQLIGRLNDTESIGTRRQALQEVKEVTAWQYKRPSR